MLLPAIALLLQTGAGDSLAVDPRRTARFDSIAPRQVPVYASVALAEVVALASRRNRTVPPALLGYRARVESEVGLLLHRAEGDDVVAGLEQTSSDVRWTRGGEYAQHVTGYRATQLALAPSMVGVMREPWTVPVLYGNRMVLLFGPDSARPSRRARSRPQRRVYLAEHPLGEERDRFYTFSGGDTVSRVRVNGRLVEVLRVRVTPRGGYPTRVVVFEGELDLDARRLQLVRMRGRFSEDGPAPGGRAGLTRRVTQGLAFVELENAEVDGAWWLPSVQRLELQATVPALGDSRSVMRIVSRWRAVRAETAPGMMADTVPGTDSAARETRAALAAAREAAAIAPAPDTIGVRPWRLSFAPRDTLDGFDAWETELGRATSDVRTTDYDDLAPDRWRPTGGPRLEWRVSRPSDAVHLNRVEGLYTGWGAVARLRDLAPGTTITATGGWAWHEGTVRGRVGVERVRGAWSGGVRAAREVALTNDFRASIDSGSTIAVLLGRDDYDYVDRTSAAAWVARRLTRDAVRPVVTRGSLGWVRDGAIAAQLACGLACGDSTFRPNRGVAEGAYARATAELELDPGMGAQSLQPGLGALARVEVAAGGLDYARLEARVTFRRHLGNTTLLARGDAGALVGGSPPPQQLFELGGIAAGLPGHDYKAYAGDRALLGRAMAMYTFPVLRRPIRLTRGFALPGIAPGVSAGISSGWASVGDRAGARRALALLGTRVVDDPAAGAVRVLPVSRPTEGVRQAVDARLRFFGGNASVGVARALERGERWRLVAGLAQGL